MAKPSQVSCHEGLVLFKNAVRGSVWSPDEGIMPIFPCFISLFPHTLAIYGKIAEW